MELGFILSTTSTLIALVLLSSLALSSFDFLSSFGGLHLYIFMLDQVALNLQSGSLYSSLIISDLSHRKMIIGHRLISQRLFDSGITLKVLTPLEEQNPPQRSLLLLIEGKIVFQRDIIAIEFFDEKGEKTIADGKQIQELLANDKTQVTLTKEGKVCIKLGQRQICFLLESKDKGIKPEENKKEKPEVDEKLMKLQQIINEQAKRLKLMQVNFDSILNKQTEDISTLKLELAQTKQQLTITKLALTSFQKQFSSLQDTLTPLVTQQEQFKCFHHPYNPHSHHFTLRLSQHCLRIIKTSDNTFHNFISSLPINQNKVNTFKIRQVKVIDGEVFIGVGTKSVFGDINSWNRDFLSYYSGDGDVCQNGLYHQGGQQIQDGQTVTVQVDLISQIVSWWLQKKQLAQAKLPQQMRGKQLYLVLLMKHKGDELDLLIDDS